MTLLERLALFSGLVVIAAMFGGLLPWWGKLHPDRIPPLVSASAGILLSTAIFHLLPEAYEINGWTVLIAAALGMLSLLLLEKSLRGYGHGHGHVHGEDREHTHGHEHEHGEGEHKHKLELGAPEKVSTLAAFLGLSLHSFFDGFALGSAQTLELQWVVFLALFVHKAPTGFSLSAILRMSNIPFKKGLVYLLVLSLFVPLGAFSFIMIPGLQTVVGVSGYALAFSAGNFFHVAIDDLLPEVNREAKDPKTAILGFLLGLALPLFVLLMPGHG
jgi:zinc and cadmium transporter